MAVWNAAPAAEVAPLAPVPVRDMGQLVLGDISRRGESRIPGFLEGLYVVDVFLNLGLMPLLTFRLVADRRHEPTSHISRPTGASGTRWWGTYRSIWCR